MVQHWTNHVILRGRFHAPRLVPLVPCLLLLAPPLVIHSPLSILLWRRCAGPCRAGRLQGERGQGRQPTSGQGGRGEGGAGLAEESVAASCTNTAQRTLRACPCARTNATGARSGTRARHLRRTAVVSAARVRNAAMDGPWSTIVLWGS